MAWTKEQEEAITRTGTNIIVSAGAGSGKTAVLTERTIRKLLNGESINKLLILTFTNAAAGEMRERIRRELKKSGLVDELDNIDSAYITTFDSFALSVVKKYHYLLNVPKNISIMDSSIEIVKTDEIINDIFLDMYSRDDFKKFIGDFCYKSDDNVKEVIKELNKKLDLLPNKIEYLSNYTDKFFSLDNINKYVDEYLDLIKKKVSQINTPYENLVSLTDNKYIEKFNLEPLLNSKTYEDIKMNIGLIGSPRKNQNCSPDFVIYKDLIMEKIKALKEYTRFNDVLDIKESLLSIKPYIKVICDIIIKLDLEFNKYKKEKNLYTFSDIALMSIKVVSENEDVKEELKNSFSEIMLDEYQDTSDIQEKFINLISNNNVYMVGDIKQSIYRFRHANPYIFRDKYDNYSKNNGGIKIDLLKNFRSREEVLDNINLIFNLIMDNNIGDAEYKLSHQMNYGNISYSNELKTSNDNNMDIFTYEKLDEYSNDEVEAFFAAHDIKEKIDNKYEVVDKNTKMLRACTYSDFAIIMDRGSSFDLYKKIFEYLGIPISQIKNEKLTSGYDITIISNLINLIIKINDKEYDNDFKYYYTSVSRSYLNKISDEELFTIVSENKYFDTELFIKCKNINILELSCYSLLNKIINEFNFYEKILTLNNIKEKQIKMEYLLNLSESLSNIGYTPKMFALYLNEMKDKESIEYSLNQNDSNSVKILNIHKSKGLEYNICYFTGLYKKKNDEEKKARFLVDSNFNIVTPYVNNGIKNTILKDLIIDKNAKDDISEKIRLFYVALTRAKEKIILVLPSNDSKDSYTTLVPDEVRLKYNSMASFLYSIYPVLTRYIKEIDFNKVILTKDYDKIKKYNYKSLIKKSNVSIIKKKNNIEYNLLNESRYSKHSNNLITIDEYNNMKEGTKFHYIFEVEDFNTTTNKYVLKFLKHIDNNYINCYKEYEFIYTSNLEVKKGIIDLLLEYEDHFDIIDYKMKNIYDLNYVKQLNGYKEYIESISKKNTNIYLYSILEDKLTKI